MKDALEIVVNNKDSECNIDKTKAYTTEATEAIGVIDVNKVYTTKQVSRISRIAPKTVAKLIDNNYLKGFKIPGSKHRRILGNFLIEFMKKNGMYEYIGERIYTTGEAAKLCRISIQSIIRCFDKKMLKGYRIPSINYRRIPRRCLIEFIRENGMYECIKDNFGEM